MAGLLTMMNLDDGARRVDVVGIAGDQDSPAHHMQALGGSSFREPLDRSSAETHLLSDKRSERHTHGHVPWYTEKRVPDVGGLGWRTKSGHLLKNQSFYPQVSGNMWNNPTFAGVNTWKEYHGPRMRADAEMMGRLDQFDGDVDMWEAKKEFVNTTRVQTLDRFYNLKHQRSQMESSSNWAPHIRAKREVHSSFETFDSTMDQKPQKELKKVFTDRVLKGDRDAVRAITSRIQNEETWKHVFKQMEQERREDLRADLQQRQAHTDRLMMLSGQPVRQHAARSTQVTNSRRTHELSNHRDSSQLRNVMDQADFRGLIHSDNAHALEALFPGSGHELATEFKDRATASAKPGWPPPPRPETPVMNLKGPPREARARQEATLSCLSIPASTHKLDTIGGRKNDVAHMEHSMSQFLPTLAAPAPDQSRSLFEEDHSPSATMRNGFRTPKGSPSAPLLDGTPARSRVGSMLSRTTTSKHPMEPSAEHLPPPRRSLVYPMMAPVSPRARDRVESNGMQSLRATHLGASASAPNFFQAAASSSSAGFQPHGFKHRRPTKSPSTKAICEELDKFEEMALSSQVANISNFTSTPRAASQPRRDR